MTHEERVQAVIDFGFTERQARFVVLVMRHAGVCVPRQYASFAGIANGGRRCNAFFDKLVRRGYAHEIDCVHNRARLYHVHHKPLYHVIGDVTSRYRRRVSPRLAVERLMLLDAVLPMPDLEWLTTAAEKAAYLARLRPPRALMRRGSNPPSTPSGTAPRALIGASRSDSNRTAASCCCTSRRNRGRMAFGASSRSTRRCCEWRRRGPCGSCFRDHSTASTMRIRRSSVRSWNRRCTPATIRELQWYFEHRREAAEGPMHPQTAGLPRDAVRRCSARPASRRCTGAG